MATIRAGTLLMLVYGKYGDNGWLGPFRVVKDIDQVQVLAQVRSRHTPSYSGRSDQSDLAAFLTSEGYMEPVDCREWYVGSQNLDEAEVWP
jgi:hypothetical protein